MDHGYKGFPEQAERFAATRQTIRFTNLQRTLWPDDGYTKGDMIAYYRDIAPIILPYLKDRPERVHRHTRGIYGRSFWHNDVVKIVPDWVRTAEIYSKRDQRTIEYFLCQDEESLLFLANLDCIELNPWHSRIGNLAMPDYAVFDLDPLNIRFEAVIEAALMTRQVLEEAGAESYCKTSGGTGLHVYVPLGARYSHDEAADFARLINVLVNSRLPATTTLIRNPQRRSGLVYLDFLQNGYGRALVAPYSLRPRRGATVSMPLLWGEVRKGLDPSRLTMKTAARRIEKTGDTWQAVLGSGIDMKSCIERLQAQLGVQTALPAKPKRYSNT